MTSRLPLTELMMGLPGARRAAASIAAGSLESIWSGSVHAPPSSSTTRSMTDASSMPGSPTLTSSASAPCSCWLIPWPTT